MHALHQPLHRIVFLCALLCAVSFLTQDRFVHVASLRAEAAMALFNTPHTDPPAAMAASSEDLYRLFRAERAFGDAMWLCRHIGARPAGGRGERHAADYLHKTLLELGYDATMQEGIPIGDSGRYTRNVVGKKLHPHESRRILIGAHYDSFPAAGCLGANDNASGVAVVLEIARVLAEVNLPYGLEIVFFGGEEAQGHHGYHFGSRHYTVTADLDDIAAMLCLDMVGRGETLHAWTLHERDTHLAGIITRSAASMGLAVQSRRGQPRSDNTSFSRAGIPALWLQRLPDTAQHTPRDTPDRLSATAMEQTGRLVLHSLAAMESLDLELLHYKK